MCLYFLLLLSEESAGAYSGCIFDMYVHAVVKENCLHKAPFFGVCSVSFSSNLLDTKILKNGVSTCYDDCCCCAGGRSRIMLTTTNLCCI